jgi:hypothetical protein
LNSTKARALGRGRRIGISSLEVVISCGSIVDVTAQAGCAAKCKG